MRVSSKDDAKTIDTPTPKSFISKKNTFFFDIIYSYLNKGGVDSYNELRPFYENAKKEGFKYVKLENLLDSKTSDKAASIEREILIELSQILKK